MTIQIQVHDGNQIKTFTYRKIYKGKNYAQLVESFYALQDGYKWGEFQQLKGNTKILWHFFGRKHDNELHA